MTAVSQRLGEVEQMMLGSVIHYGIDRFQDLSAVDVRPEQFSNQRHRLVYSAIVEALNAGEDVNLLTVVQTLEDRGELLQAGGASYVAHLTCIDNLWPGPLSPIIREWHDLKQAHGRLQELTREMGQLDELLVGGAR